MGTGVFEELPKNGGAEYRPKGKPRHVYDHDWLIKELGKVAPFGIYNLNNNVGYVNLGQSRDTAALASESVARWWHFIDEENFPGCRKLFIVCDGGGDVYKRQLQDGLKGTVGIAHTRCATHGSP